MKKHLKTSVCIVGSGFCGYAAYKKLKEEIEDTQLFDQENNEEEDLKDSTICLILTVSVLTFSCSAWCFARSTDSVYS